jgi:lysophospholipase L1-like esterase
MTRRNIPPSADIWPLLRLNNWHRSWADLVEEWIFAHRPDLQIKCRQAAVGGSTIADLEARYEVQVKPHRPSWILFTLGTNDYSRGIPLDDFRARLIDYIQTAQRDSGARFFYTGGFLTMPGLPALEVPKITGAQPYFQAVRDVVCASGGIAPEIGEIMKEKAEQHFAASPYHTFYSDGSHFAPLGNHVLAGIVLEHLHIFT